MDGGGSTRTVQRAGSFVAWIHTDMGCLSHSVQQVATVFQQEDRWGCFVLVLQASWKLTSFRYKIHRKFQCLTNGGHVLDISDQSDMGHQN